jgi:hypothetical protein
MLANADEWTQVEPVVATSGGKPLVVVESRGSREYCCSPSILQQGEFNAKWPDRTRDLDTADAWTGFRCAYDREPADCR